MSDLRKKTYPQETLTDQTQKQFEEIFSQKKIKSHVRDFYANLFNFKPMNPDRGEIKNSIGRDNIKTPTPDELSEAEK